MRVSDILPTIDATLHKMAPPIHYAVLSRTHQSISWGHGASETFRLLCLLIKHRGAVRHQVLMRLPNPPRPEPVDYRASYNVCCRTLERMVTRHCDDCRLNWETNVEPNLPNLTSWDSYVKEMAFLASFKFCMPTVDLFPKDLVTYGDDYVHRVTRIKDLLDSVDEPYLFVMEHWDSAKACHVIWKKSNDATLPGVDFIEEWLGGS